MGAPGRRRITGLRFPVDPANPSYPRHSHEAFIRAAEAYGRGILRLGPDDVTVAAPKLHFGYAMGTNLLFPLSVGASVVLFEERATAAVLASRMRRHQATVLVTTPAMVRQMTGGDPGFKNALATLRVATSAGEALPSTLHQRWRERIGVELIDGLGMTEMCHIVVSNQIGEAAPGSLGQWVAPRAVEECLLQHPQVRDVAVMGVKDDDGLVRGHLAPHAHPRGVTYVDALPRTPQGKRDRAALVRLA